MTNQWTSRLGEGLAALFRWSEPGPSASSRLYPSVGADRDADDRRIRAELDAIRVRFPDHA